MALAYLNLVAMIVGYATIAVVLLIILAFIALVLREKYNDWKWRNQKEKEKQPSPAVANKPAEQPKEAVKDAAQDNPNVQVSIK